MKKESSSYGLILSSIVAIVALVGLVMLFSKAGATGATTSYNLCPAGQVLGYVVDEFGTHQACVPNVEGERPFETPADTNTANLVE